MGCQLDKAFGDGFPIQRRLRTNANERNNETKQRWPNRATPVIWFKSFGLVFGCMVCSFGFAPACSVLPVRFNWSRPRGHQSMSKSPTRCPLSMQLQAAIDSRRCCGRRTIKHLVRLIALGASFYTMTKQSQATKLSNGTSGRWSVYICLFLNWGQRVCPRKISGYASERSSPPTWSSADLAWLK